MSHPDYDSTGLGYGPHDDASSDITSGIHDQLPAFGAEQAPYGTLGEAETGSSVEFGNPGEYEHYWFYQEHNGYCVPASVTQVIEAQTGLTMHSYTLVEREAHNLGFPAGPPGLTLDQAQELLQHFDIPSQVEFAGSSPQAILVAGSAGQAAADELAGYLVQGKDIIVGVNANPIWFGTEDSPQDPDGQPDHALVVTAINVGTGAVTLSDPGTPGGNEETVSLDIFMDAWRASGYQMLVTDDPVGGADHQAATRTVDDMEPLSPIITPDNEPLAPRITTDLESPVPSVAEDIVHNAGFVLLPIVLTAGWLATPAAKNRYRAADPRRD